jgi:hypothetical protein
MGLTAIRRVVLPGVRTARSALLSVLLMAAVALGLVAMHDSGSEHVAHAAVSTGTATHADQHGGADATPLAEPMTSVVAAATAFAAECGSDCAADLLGCAAAALACAMMIALGIMLALASRPAMFRRLLDAGGAVQLVAREIFGGHRRPDLHVLSISRT